MGPRPLTTTEVLKRSTLMGGKPSQPVPPCHDRSPLSSPACEAKWQRPTADSFYVRGFASPAAICSGSVATATEGIVTVAIAAEKKFVAYSATKPITGMSRVSVSKGVKIIASASATIASA